MASMPFPPSRSAESPSAGTASVTGAREKGLPQLGEDLSLVQVSVWALKPEAEDPGLPLQ